MSLVSKFTKYRKYVLTFWKFRGDRHHTGDVIFIIGTIANEYKYLRKLDISIGPNGYDPGVDLILIILNDDEGFTPICPNWYHWDSKYTIEKAKKHNAKIQTR